MPDLAGDLPDLAADLPDLAADLPPLTAADTTAASLSSGSVPGPGTARQDREGNAGYGSLRKTMSGS